jgi:hypothetical protein
MVVPRHGESISHCRYFGESVEDQLHCTEARIDDDDEDDAVVFLSWQGSTNGRAGAETRCHVIVKLLQLHRRHSFSLDGLYLPYACSESSLFRICSLISPGYGECTEHSRTSFVHSHRAWPPRKSADLVCIDGIRSPSRLQSSISSLSTA